MKPIMRNKSYLNKHTNEDVAWAKYCFASFWPIWTYLFYQFQRTAFTKFQRKDVSMGT